MIYDRNEEFNWQNLLAKILFAITITLLSSYWNYCQHIGREDCIYTSTASGQGWKAFSDRYFWSALSQLLGNPFDSLMDFLSSSSQWLSNPFDFFINIFGPHCHGHNALLSMKFILFILWILVIFFRHNDKLWLDLCFHYALIFSELSCFWPFKVFKVWSKLRP